MEMIGGECSVEQIQRQSSDRMVMELESRRRMMMMMFSVIAETLVVICRV